MRSLGIGIGKDTVLGFFYEAMESYFVFLIEEFEKSKRKRKVNPKKLYIIVTGYFTALGYEFSVSRAMENVVFIELLRRGYNEIYYWRGKKKLIS